MSFQGRSLDDMPLAAYTTGVAPDEEESLDELDETPAPAHTQQELAAALVEPAAPAAPAKAAGRSLSVPSLKLPSLRRSKPKASKENAPFQPVAGSTPAPAEYQAPHPSFQAVRPDMAPSSIPTPRVAAPQAAFAAAAPAMSRGAIPAARPAVQAAPVMRPPRKVSLEPRRLVRDPRVLAGGVVVIGAVLLGISLLGGGPNSGLAGPHGSQDTGAGPTTQPVLGDASVEVTAGTTSTVALTGATGAGPAVDNQVNATWTAVTGESLSLAGLASQGVRTTDPTFVLTWTMLVDGASVTFTSRASECTVGMAVAATAVHGTFVCKKLASPDGKHVIELHGTYTT